MTSFKPEQFGKGALRAPEDKRNYIYEEILGAGEPFDWGKGFDIEEKTGKLKVENQNGSSSCVAQATSKYLEVLNILDEEKFVDLSARDIYSRIFIDGGGAYIVDGMKLAVNRGVLREATAPSYDNGKPPSEAYMRIKIEGNEEEAKIYSSKSYATTKKQNIDFIAQMIRDNNGLVSGFVGTNEGWKTADIRPPKQGETGWQHAVYLGKARIRNGKKMIGLLNSWGEEAGEKGWQWFSEDYLPQMFDLWTLMDNINQPNLNIMRLVGDKKTGKQFAVGSDKVAHWIFNVAALEQYHAAGIIDKNKIEWEDNVEERYIRGDVWAVIRS